VRSVGFATSLVLAACIGTAAAIAATGSSMASAANAPPQASPPPRDSDGDGIPDRDDKCPADAETQNGYQDDDGCPDLAPRPPASPGDLGRIVERIGFQHDNPELKPASFPMLDAIAIIIKMQPQQFPLVALEGHAADNERSPMRLSLARASAVRVGLIARGVDAGRLLARASGATAPACTERNEVCWARERTVEFMTLPAPKSESAAEAEAAEGEAARAPEKKPEREHVDPQIPLQRVDFKKGSAVLAPSSLADLDVLSGFMKSNPVSLEIVGYADDSERRAAELAQARADSVRGYMMACGVSGTHLTTRAQRTGRAACRSHSANCPARNGRAELRFVDPHPAAPPAGDAPPATRRDDSK
jgi:outer membrane protein OmpA-like peptidoglycan-associated protein